MYVISCLNVVIYYFNENNNVDSGRILVLNNLNA
jgi:hypothetical protein